MTKSLKERKARLLKLIRSFEAADETVISDVELDETDEQIPEELEADDLDVVEDEELVDTDDEELVEDDEELVDAGDDDELEADDELVEDEDDTFDVADDKQDEALVELPEDEDDDAIVSDDEEDLSFLDDEQDGVTASETPKIGDEAKGGDPSVSEIVKNDVDVNTDAEVFPTDSEYVAKITARLDKVANYLEKTGKKRMAYRLDVLSDKLEASIRK